LAAGRTMKALCALYKQLEHRRSNRLCVFP
jgi:hypothetical protein